MFFPRLAEFSAWMEKYIIQKVRPLLFCQKKGAEEKKSRKMVSVKDRVSFPNLITHSRGNTSTFPWGSPLLMLLLLCCRCTLSGQRGWNQDSGQTGETLTRSRVPCQHYRHEGLRGKWTCLRNIHHRCCSHLQCSCLWVSSWEMFLSTNPSGSGLNWEHQRIRFWPIFSLLRAGKTWLHPQPLLAPVSWGRVEERTQVWETYWAGLKSQVYHF